MPSKLQKETGEEAKVFVSYSRQDMAFVDELDSALSARGIKTLIDRTDIEKSADWWERIQQLIGQADTRPSLGCLHRAAAGCARAWRYGE
jgi:hypothetical protein